MSTQERFRTIIVGGGQAGLAAAYFLSQATDEFIILDEGAGFGRSWRGRWDSLRLFTPAKFSSLPWMAFPGEDFSFPTKDEAARYLERYADALKPPVRFNTRVDSLDRGEDGFQLSCGTRRFLCSRVIVATGTYQKPFVPLFAPQLDPGIFQLHSSGYRNPLQLPQGSVLVAGAGNSGAEIAIELARSGRRVWLSGRDVRRIPANVLGRILGGKPYWWLISRVLSVDTPIGRSAKRTALARGTPLIGLKSQEVVEAGVTRVGRMAGVSGGRPRLDDEHALDVSTVVWATGFRPDYSWIKLPVFDEHGYPKHERGVVPGVEGLFFLGLPFQSSLSSSLMGGVGSDACFISQCATRTPHGPGHRRTARSFASRGVSGEYAARCSGPAARAS
jgi:putative flavoprotein involved in K+ transport